MTTWARTYPGGINPDDPATAVTDTWGNNVDQGLEDIYDDGAANDVLTSDGSGIVWQKIGNAMVATNAAIAYSKLNLAGSIVNADVGAAAAIAYSKLNLATSIVNADVSASAAIALSKLAASAWTTYTPTLTGAGGNPVMGSGNTVSGRYMKIGRLVVARVVIIFGTTPTGPTGLWGVALPEAVQANNIVGTGLVYDNSPGATYAVINQATAATVCNLFYHGGDRFSGTTPITVAAGDQIQLNLVYESVS